MYRTVVTFCTCVWKRFGILPPPSEMVWNQFHTGQPSLASLFCGVIYTRRRGRGGKGQGCQVDISPTKSFCFGIMIMNINFYIFHVFVFFTHPRTTPHFRHCWKTEASTQLPTYIVQENEKITHLWMRTRRANLCLRNHVVLQTNELFSAFGCRQVFIISVYSLALARSPMASDFCWRASDFPKYLHGLASQIFVENFSEKWEKLKKIF